ncbi:hypothetical protein, partial [Bacillus pseudomycoides]|uniref:hypothetical protein n=1 Tax=Bacillus pseudomycoides TaxID=64104 RepID=UPI0028526BCF
VSMGKIEAGYRTKSRYIKRKRGRIARGLVSEGDIMMRVYTHQAEKKFCKEIDAAKLGIQKI